MQIPPLPPSSLDWPDKILWMFGGGTLVGGIVALIKLIFYRHKPKADVAKIAAETGQTQADTAVKLSSQLIVLHDRMGLMEASIDQHQRETAQTIAYYRGQIEYFEKLDSVYRNRMHELCGELGRVVMALTNLQADYVEKTGEKAAHVEIRTYDEIIKPYPLPSPPE
jgi:hypothetical protein